MHAMASNKEIVQWFESRTAETDSFLDSLRKQYIKDKVAAWSRAMPDLGLN